MKTINEYYLDTIIKNDIVPSESDTIMGIIQDAPATVKCEFYEDGWHEITATQLRYLMYVASCRKKQISMNVRFTYKGNIIDRDMFSKHGGITEFILQIDEEGALDWHCPAGFLNFDKLLSSKTRENLIERK